ncbi:MAG: holo-ACP synthase [bacterium]
MVNGIGIDLVEVDRMDQILNKWQERFVTRVFSPNEIQNCNQRVNKAQCFAARFAAKEALAKALGHGWCKHFKWTDVEVVNEASGKPSFNIKGVTSNLVKAKRIRLSLSHTKSYAVATVTVESA